jgi:hypothetical protein
LGETAAATLLIAGLTSQTHLFDGNMFLNDELQCAGYQYSLPDKFILRAFFNRHAAKNDKLELFPGTPKVCKKTFLYQRRRITKVLSL